MTTLASAPSPYDPHTLIRLAESQKPKRSCYYCQRGHHSCDGVLPCSRCARLKKQCFFTQPKKRGPKVRKNSESPPPQDADSSCDEDKEKTPKTGSHSSRASNNNAFNFNSTGASNNSDLIAGLLAELHSMKNTQARILAELKNVKSQAEKSKSKVNPERVVDFQTTIYNSPILNGSEKSHILAKYKEHQNPSQVTMSASLLEHLMKQLQSMEDENQPCVLFHVGGYLLTANNCFCKTFKYDLTPIIGWHFSRFMPEDILAEMCKKFIHLVKQATPNGNASLQFSGHQLTGTGESVPVFVRQQVFYDAGCKIQFVLYQPKPVERESPEQGSLAMSSSSLGADVSLLNTSSTSVENSILNISNLNNNNKFETNGNTNTVNPLTSSLGFSFLSSSFGSAFGSERNEDMLFYMLDDVLLGQQPQSAVSSSQHPSH